MHRVSPRALWYWAAKAAVLWIVLAIPQVIWWFADGDGAKFSHLIVGVAWLVLAAVHLVVMPQWRFRVHRWEATDTAVYTQTGWWARERRIAPMSRIQTVDHVEGALSRLFGLATVTVTTASAAGALEIAGLDKDVARRLVDELTVKADAVEGDAT